MKDTSPEMEDIYRNLLMKRSGSDRLKMASDMFDTARALVRASLQGQNLSESEIKKSIFIRFYGKDFTTVTLEKILAKLPV